jgi:AhpD family alkylhydroperoxidase
MSNSDIKYIEKSRDQSAETLESIRELVGFVPNIFTAISESPSALEAFVGLNNSFANSSFTDEEQQVIQLAASTENEGEYCVAGHSAFADTMGVPETVVSAIREELAVVDLRLAALGRVVHSLIGNRGRIEQGEIDAFIEVGYTQAQFIEVILGISLKTFSNYASSALKVPLDSGFRKYAWRRSQ